MNTTSFLQRGVFWREDGAGITRPSIPKLTPRELIVQANAGENGRAKGWYGV